MKYSFFIQSRSFVHYNNIHDIPRSILHIMIMSIWFGWNNFKAKSKKAISWEVNSIYTWNTNHWMIFDTSTFQDSMRSILSTSLAVLELSLFSPASLTFTIQAACVFFLATLEMGKNQVSINIRPLKVIVSNIKWKKSAKQF